MVIGIKEKIILIVAIILFLVFCAMFGCMTFQCEPSRQDYTCEECYVAADILYRLKDDKDKAVAAPIVEACRDAMKERRAIERLKYCKDNTPAGMSENECRMWLNQK